MPQQNSTPSFIQRLAVALLIGTLCALACYARYHATPYAGDFTWPLRGAAHLWHGQNPYRDPQLGPGKPYPFNDPLFYPLPALFVATPFLPVSRPVGGALFIGLSTGLLAFGVTRNRWQLLPIFLSAPFWSAVFTVQWAPLILAPAFLPALAPLALAKPNIGLPVLVSAPSRRSVVTSTVVILISLLVAPSWPWDWLGNMHQHQSFVPALVFPGPLVLLAAWRWRDGNARLLVLMAFLPQRAIYDQLVLWTVCHSWRDTLLLSACSWMGVVGWWLGPVVVQQWIVVSMYVPALGIVLWPALVPHVVARARSGTLLGQIGRFHTFVRRLTD